MKAFVKNIISLCSLITEYHDLHPVRLVKKKAAEETAKYINENMPHAMGFYREDDILNFSVRSARISGCFLEFGVFKGRSIRRMARLVGPDQEIHGFDSFQGLPESWSGFAPAGKFSVNGQLPKVPANVLLHQGLFDEVLPKWLDKYPGNASFIHIDCDLYSSTKVVFDLLWNRIQCGTIILFDEYYNYHNWQEHEFKAFHEFVASRKVKYEYIAYSWTQAAVIIKEIGS